MKRTILPLAVAATMALFAAAQTLPETSKAQSPDFASAQPDDTPNNQSTGVSSLQDLPPYEVVERGPNMNVWERTVIETSPTGQKYAVKHRFTELGTGINFFDQ